MSTLPAVKSKEINGKTYNIILLGTREGLSVSMKIGKAILPAVVDVVGAMRGADELNFTDAVNHLFTQLTDKEMGEILDKLFKGSTADDFPINWDTYFRGNYGELCDVVAFALEANFSSFFEASIFKNLFSTSQK